jgi:hypothetical protein
MKTFFRNLLVLAFLLSGAAHGAITDVADSTDVTGTGSSRTPAEPTGTQQDDLVTAFCTIVSTDGTWTDPADFTEITQKTQSIGGTTVHAYLGYKKRGADAGSGYTFSYSGTAANIRCTLQTFRGQDTTTALDVAYVEANHYNATANDAGATAAQPITTNTDGAAVVLYQWVSTDTDIDPVAPSNYDLVHASEVTNRTFNIAFRLIAAAGTETPGAWQHTNVGATADSVNFTLAIKPAAASGPSFSAGPSRAAAENGHTISGTITCTGTCTVYAVAVNPGAPAPSCAQIKTGDDGNGTDAAIAANEAWTSGAGDSFALTAAGSWPRHDVHVCGSDGTSNTSVTSFTDVNRSADASQAITVLTSVSATSIFALQTVANCDTTSGSAILTGCGDTSWLQSGMVVDLSAGFADLTNIIVESVTSDTITLELAANSTSSNITVTQDTYYSPSVATGDVIEGATTIEGETVTVGADGEISWPDATGNYATWAYNIQDVSDTSDGDFDSGPPAWSSGDDTVHFFSTRPVINLDTGQSAYLLYKDVDMGTVSLSCTDADSQTTSIIERDAEPTGTEIATNGNWTGTPTVEDESGSTITLDCSDTGGLYATARQITVYVTDDEVTMPTIDDGSITDALTDLAAVRPWLESIDQLTATYECSSSEDVNQVISQDPAASSTIDATESVSVVVSTGSCLKSRQRAIGIKIGVH